MSGQEPDETAVGRDVRSDGVTLRRAVIHTSHSRREMVDFLLDHRSYHTDGRTFLSWDIKIRDFVEPTRDGFDLDPAFDERWEQYQEANSARLFEQACESVLDGFTDGSFTASDAPLRLPVQLGTAGRSGGHLILRSWVTPSLRVQDLSTGSASDFASYLNEEMEDDELASLHAVVRAVDAGVARRYRLVCDEFANIRTNMEYEWAEEAAPYGGM